MYERIPHSCIPTNFTGDLYNEPRLGRVVWFLLYIGLIHIFTAQTSSTEEVPLDSRRLSFRLSGVSRSITRRRVSGKQAIDVISISCFCLPHARQLGVGYSGGVKEVFM
jgi:hypothetical protein